MTFESTLGSNWFIIQDERPQTLEQLHARWDDGGRSSGNAGHGGRKVRERMDGSARHWRNCWSGRHQRLSDAEQSFTSIVVQAALGGANELEPSRRPHRGTSR